jgi:hypothetical protein
MFVTVEQLLNKILFKPMLDSQSTTLFIILTVIGADNISMRDKNII